MIDFSISRSEFLTEYFEKKPLLIKGCVERGFIKWSDIDNFIYIGESFGAGARLNKGGFVPDVDYSVVCKDVGLAKRVIRKAKFYDELKNGSTMVFNRIESICPKTRAITKVLSRYSGEQTVANGYLAFGQDEALGHHWDTHDVFAVQLLGRKKWIIYEPTFPTPLVHQKSLIYKAERPQKPYMELELEQGDILYIPRGWWNTALPLGEETYHLAVGVHCKTLIDYVTYVAERILPEHLTFRKSLPLDASAGHGIHFEEAALELNQILSAKENFDKYMSFRQNCELEGAKIDLARHVVDGVNSNEFPPNSNFIVNSKLSTLNLLNATKINGVPFEAREIHPNLHAAMFGEKIVFSYAELVENLSTEERGCITSQINTLLKSTVLDQV